MFLCEQGSGGVVQFPKEFLKKAYELVRKNGGVCISDEVLICLFIDCLRNNFHCMLNIL
jgi:glutamate-1-semialdehyde aminotransferase